jgi:hypothetical protein
MTQPSATIAGVTGSGTIIVAGKGDLGKKSIAISTGIVSRERADLRYSDKEGQHRRRRGIVALASVPEVLVDTRLRAEWLSRAVLGPRLSHSGGICMSVYAVVQNGVVVNVVVCEEGMEGWTCPDQCQCICIDDYPSVGIGWTYADGSFIPPATA